MLRWLTLLTLGFELGICNGHLNIKDALCMTGERLLTLSFIESNFILLTMEEPWRVKTYS